MSGINFKGAEIPSESTMTRPGTIDVFDIKEVVFGTTTGKSTYYCGVTFARKNDSFKHSFFLTEKAVGRLKGFIKSVTGVELDEQVLEAQIVTMLTGKKVALKVTGKIDTANGRAYPDLSYGGFAKKAELISELAFSDTENDLNKQALEVIARGSAAKPDAASAPTSGELSPTAKDEDIF